VTPADPDSSLDAFFSPSSIAVVGASAGGVKTGAVPLRYLIAQKFAGPIYPIHPTQPEVQGLRAYASLRAVGRPVDLAIFAVPARHALQALEDAVACGVKSIVMFTAGFAETGEDGARAQRQFAVRARQAGIRLLGPNCLGFMNAGRRIYATFSPVVAGGLAPVGSVGIASQSGAFGAYAYGMARERKVGLSMWVATGNEADIDVADCIAWMARDPGTRVIMAYMEGCSDGNKLKNALRLAREAGKPVVVVKVGRTELGAQAAASHTAALAGDDAAFNALFRQYGVWRARSIDEFFDVAHCLSVSVLPVNPRVGLLTVSGGVGVLMSDDAHDAGLELAPLASAARERILARVPFAATRNPVDITGQVTSEPDLLGLAADAMLGEGGYGSLLVFLAAAGLTPELQETQRQVAQQLRQAYPDRLLIFSSLTTPAQQDALQALGCLSFTEPGRAIRVLAALNFFATQAREGAALPPAAAPAGCIALRPGNYNEADALALLRAHGLPAAECRAAQDRETAMAAARDLGFPVVMKVLSPDILHKSDAGGVVVGIADEQAAGQAFDAILCKVRAAQPQARIDGVLVATLVKGGVECILGVHRDPVLGALLMLGAGGVNAELLRDVSFRMVPVDLQQARAMTADLKTSALFHGFRGAPPADLDALARAIVSLSDFAVAAGDSLEAVEVNPFAVLPQGQGGAALDAVLVGRACPAPAGDPALDPFVLQTLPLFEMARMRSANTARRHPAHGFAGDGPASTLRWVNQFTHTRRLRGPEDREVVTPNNDTLFTNAWLDLSAGPLVIQVPEMGDRYWTLGFLDAWTNPWAYAGRRTTGGAQQQVFVHGPAWKGQAPAGMHVICAPGDDVWIIGRILVDHDRADLARVHALQDQFSLTSPDGSPALSRLDVLLDGRRSEVPRSEEYLRITSAMLERNPPAKPLSSGPAGGAALDVALQSVYSALRAAPAAAGPGGWTPAVSVRTDFGDDFFTRARVARNWIGTLGIEEAMYIMAEVDADGEVLDGAHRYVLRFAADAQLQVDAFWSVTLYQREDCLLAPNPINRHSIGDRTRGLVRDADGGMTLCIQADDPGEGRNWLPSPAGKGFYLTLRLYQPRPVHLDRRFAYPPVTKVKVAEAASLATNPPECRKMLSKG
jgi:acyl-CoA synthetase (NDP forming)